MRHTIYAKVIETFLGKGIAIQGQEEDVLVSNSSGIEPTKREFEREHPHYTVIWLN